MRKVTAKIAGNPEAVAMLRKIQDQMRDICEPHYDEFYRVTTERGFTKITLPKRKAG
jgi:hypothetical protein